MFETMCNLHHPSMTQEALTQKLGYLEIKQSSKVKPRKLKSWRRKWVVLTKMSNLSSEEYAAKMDLYDTEAKWKSNSQDKTTYVLENVQRIQYNKSKTRPHAFEIVQQWPTWVLSGSTELESYSWILTLQQIFTPDQIEAKKGCYNVTVRGNEHSNKWNFAGEYSLSISPTGINLMDRAGHCAISWGLSTLMKFNVEKEPAIGLGDMLVIECGPNAPTGHSVFHFLSDEATEILSAIKQSICLALAQKHNARKTVPTRPRSSSATVSEKNFQKLLDDHAGFSNASHERTDSDSSNSTTLSSPSSHESASKFARTNSELDALVESSDERHETAEHTSETLSKHSLPCSRSSKSLKHDGYSAIKDASAGPVPRRYTISSEPTDIDFDRLRSASAIAASLKEANLGALEKLEKGVKFEDEDRSDLDSAISSMTFSITNEETPKKEPTHYQELDPEKRQEERIHLNELHRRRASSTPDLQTFWKRCAGVSKFENVYEELDELRASVQRLNKRRESDIPPELPARPLSINFTSHTLNYKDGEKPTAPLAGNHYGASGDRQAYLMKFTGNCKCSSATLERRNSSPNTAQCLVCGGHVPFYLKTRTDVSVSSSNEALIPSSNSSISDLYAGSTEILMRRRRSSDITPVSVSLSTLAAVNRSVNERGKAAGLPHLSSIRDREANPLQPKPQEQESLISFDVPANSSPSSRTGSQSVKGHSSSNPLIDFFLDEQTFNQIVTGQILVNSAPPQANVDLLKNSFGDVFPQPTRPVSMPAVPASMSAVSLVHHHNIATSHFPASPLSLGSPFTPFGCVNVWSTSMSNSRGNNNIPGSNLPARHNLFEQDPFSWGHRKDTSRAAMSLQQPGFMGRTNSTLRNVENDYMSMSEKQMTNYGGQVKTFLSDNEKEAIYVRPSSATTQKK